MYFVVCSATNSFCIITNKKCVWKPVFKNLAMYSVLNMLHVVPLLNFYLFEVVSLKIVLETGL